ncbi:MAG: hypothetical protein H0U57_09100 [Tatlockia sp.]|nr:hypothetical protein [Tatlockia sp.]
MRKLSLYALLIILAGCSAPGGGSMNAAGPAAASLTYAGTSSRTPTTGVDVKAINAAIAANRGPFLAPEDEVMQQRMTDPY